MLVEQAFTVFTCFYCFYEYLDKIQYEFPFSIRLLQKSFVEDVGTVGHSVNS